MRREARRQSIKRPAVPTAAQAHALAPTPVETLVKAHDFARAEGLHYVYIGNVPGLEGVETTYCPNCKKAVIERDIFAVTRMDITDGKCRFCGTKIDAHRDLCLNYFKRRVK